MPPTLVFEKITQNTHFKKKERKKLGSKAKLVF